jgi:hypothetical protein
MPTTQRHKRECDAQLLSAGAGVVPTEAAGGAAEAVAEAAEATRLAARLVAGVIEAAEAAEEAAARTIRAAGGLVAGALGATA